MNFNSEHVLVISFKTIIMEALWKKLSRILTIICETPLTGWYSWMNRPSGPNPMKYSSWYTKIWTALAHTFFRVRITRGSTLLYFMPPFVQNTGITKRLHKTYHASYINNMAIRTRLLVSVYTIFHNAQRAFNLVLIYDLFIPMIWICVLKSSSFDKPNTNPRYFFAT